MQVTNNGQRHINKYEKVNYQVHKDCLCGEQKQQNGDLFFHPSKAPKPR